MTVSENISIASYVTHVVKVKNNKIVQVNKKKTKVTIIAKSKNFVGEKPIPLAN